MPQTRTTSAALCGTQLTLLTYILNESTTTYLQVPQNEDHQCGPLCGTQPGQARHQLLREIPHLSLWSTLNEPQRDRLLRAERRFRVFWAGFAPHKGGRSKAAALTPRMHMAMHALSYLYMHSVHSLIRVRVLCAMQGREQSCCAHTSTDMDSLLWPAPAVCTCRPTWPTRYELHAQ